MCKHVFRKMMLIFVMLSCAMVVKHPIVFANSSEPPAIIIIIEDATDETQVSLVNGNEQVEAQYITDKIFEKQYAFYYHEAVWQWGEKTHLAVVSGEQKLDFDFPSATAQYRNVYTVDLASEQLTEGMSALRQIKWTLRRVSITVAIEGLIFIAFGYRKRRTFIVFLVMNLITQGYLNVTLSGLSIGSYVIFGLVALEVLILITELIIGLIAIKEHTRWRTALCIFLSNVVSLFVGGAMLMILPA